MDTENSPIPPSSSEKPQAIGGRARWEGKTPEEKKAAASQAAKERWQKAKAAVKAAVAMKMEQSEFEFIPHQCENALILQRAVDGYVNATAMCQAVGKLFGHYWETKTTRAFLEELSSDIGIPISGLVIVKKGGKIGEQGTWVHPDVAINLGQWCSPKFAVAVAKWVREWITGKARVELPYHVRRYMANMSEIPHTHFSILNEMIFGLIGPLEAKGFTVPEHMMPDISQGRMFCKWLRDVKGIDTDTLPTYRHAFEDGRIVYPKLYPGSLRQDFLHFFHEQWLPDRSLGYFQEKAPEALPYLQQVIAALPAPVTD